MSNATNNSGAESASAKSVEYKDIIPLKFNIATAEEIRESTKNLTEREDFNVLSDLGTYQTLQQFNNLNKYTFKRSSNILFTKPTNNNFEEIKKLAKKY